MQEMQRLGHSRVGGATRPGTSYRHSTRSPLQGGTWRLHALSKSNPTSHNYQVAALLDVEQQFGPTGVHGGTARLTSSSTSWQQPAQGSSSTLMHTPGSVVEDERPAQHTSPAVHAAAGKRHIHTAFGAFFCYLALITAATTNPDWYLDTATFGGLWAVLWVACNRLQPSANTAALLCLLPVMHLSGALGMYHWELGNLSWDVLVHITNGFIGTLLFASALADVSSAAAASGRAAGGNVSAEAGRSGISSASGKGLGQRRVWHERALSVLKVTALLLLSTTMVEVVEAAGGQLAGHAGEGIFLRGPGDTCTASLPCSEEVDSLKDMVDNCEGMMLALLALATRGGSNSARSSTHA